MTDTESQPPDLEDTGDDFRWRYCTVNDCSTHPFMYKSPQLDLFNSWEELSVGFISSFEFPYVPPHRMYLKVGVPVILMWNREEPWLGNGSRLIVKQN